MTKKLKLKLMLSLIASLLLKPTSSLAVDLPQALLPSAPNAFWCTDRLGLEKMVSAEKENKASHLQIQHEGIDYVLVGEAILSGIIAGIVIDKTLFKNY